MKVEEIFNLPQKNLNARLFIIGETNRFRHKREISDDH